MKILGIILLAVFLLSIIPLNGFCDDPHQENVTHDCTAVCHAPCCQSVLPSSAIGFSLPAQSSFLCLAESLSPEDPFLSTSVRPPIVSA